MNKATVKAETEAEAIKTCWELHGWTPDTVREVDSGEEDTKAYICFESASDANLWDKQK